MADDSRPIPFTEKIQLTRTRDPLIVDHSAITARVIRASYEEEYRDTQNAHQLITAFRKIMGLSQPKMGKVFGCDPSRISRFELGFSLPSKETLKQLEKNVLEEDSDWKDFTKRLMSMVISNRLAIINDIYEKRFERFDAMAYVNQIAELPAIYWQATLLKINNPHAAQTLTETATWAKQIIPITSKMEYLRAVRYALSLTDDQIEHATGLTQNDVKGIEYGDISLDGKAAKDLIDYYTKKSTELSESADATPCFDAAVYAGLDDGQKLFKPRESPRHRASGRAVT